MKKMRLFVLFGISMLALLVLVGQSKPVHAATQPVDLVARYSLKDMDAKTLATIKQIDAEHDDVSTHVEGDNLVIDTMVGNGPSNEMDSKMEMNATGYKKLDFGEYIDKMDEMRNQQGHSEQQTNVIINPGSGYKGQDNGDKVLTGDYVHCDRLNGPASDHHYWKHSLPQAWIDFVGSDCYDNALAYGCYSEESVSMAACQGLDENGIGVHDCSEITPGLPMTAWFRN